MDQLNWANSKITHFEIHVDSKARARPVSVVYAGRTVASFDTSPGLHRVFNM